MQWLIPKIRNAKGNKNSPVWTLQILHPLSPFLLSRHLNTYFLSVYHSIHFPLPFLLPFIFFFTNSFNFLLPISRYLCALPNFSCPHSAFSLFFPNSPILFLFFLFPTFVLLGFTLLIPILVAIHQV